MEKSRIGTFESVSVITIALITKIFFTSTSIPIQRVGTAAWYMTIISCIIAVFFFYLTYLLIKRFPGKSILNISEMVLGKAIGKIINLVFFAFGLFYTTSTLREFVEMIKVYNLPHTPISLVTGVFLIVISIIAYYSSEGLGRVAALCFIPIIAGLAILLLLAIPLYDVNNIKPILGYGIDKTLKYGFLRSSAYAEIIALTIFTPTIQGPKQYRKVGLISLFLAGAIASISLLLYTMAFGYNSGSENLSGLFELSRSIYYNRFFQRLESIFIFIWVISSVITVSVAYLVSLKTYSVTFKIKNAKPLIIPLSILTFAVSVIPKNIAEVLNINIKLLRQYSMFPIYTTPVLILLIAIIRKKKGSDNNAKKSRHSNNSN